MKNKIGGDLTDVLVFETNNWISCKTKIILFFGITVEFSVSSFSNMLKIDTHRRVELPRRETMNWKIIHEPIKNK